MNIKRYFPKTFSDIAAFLFLFTAVISCYIFELYVVLPKIQGDSIFRYVHTVLGTYIFVNLLGNLAKLMCTDTSSRTFILPSLLKPCWKFCFTCEANSPPRSFHCDKCRTCVLKRDHHCTFAGCCVGLKNFRYYVVFLFYLSIGALYATVLNMFFIWDVLGGFSVFAVLAHVIPFVFWVFGYLNLKAMFFSLMSVISITGFLFVFNLLILHVQQMLKNQTSFERNHRICDYDLGWRQNLVESLGSKWNLIWIFPSINSPLPSDGLVFFTKDNFFTSMGKMK